MLSSLPIYGGVGRSQVGYLVLMYQDTDRTVKMAGFSGRRHKQDWEEWFASLAEADEYRRKPTITTWFTTSGPP
jgi:hypothetical protein